MCNFIIASRESHAIRILIPILLVRKLKPIVVKQCIQGQMAGDWPDWNQVDLTPESMLLLHHMGVGTWKEAEGLIRLYCPSSQASGHCAVS